MNKKEALFKPEDFYIEDKFNISCSPVEASDIANKKFKDFLDFLETKIAPRKRAKSKKK